MRKKEKKTKPKMTGGKQAIFVFFTGIVFWLLGMGFINVLRSREELYCLGYAMGLLAIAIPVLVLDRIGTIKL